MGPLDKQMASLLRIVVTQKLSGSHPVGKIINALSHHNANNGLKGDFLS